MHNIQISCSNEDREWLEAAIETYQKEFAGTPPWKDAEENDDINDDNEVTGVIEWDTPEIEIEPAQCPHCRGTCVTMTAEYNAFPPKARGYFVICNGCGSRTGYHRTKLGAIKSWNRRAGQA